MEKYDLIANLIILAAMVMIAIISTFLPFLALREVTFRGYGDYCFIVRSNDSSIYISLVPPSIACFKRAVMNIHVKLMCKSEEAMVETALERTRFGALLRITGRLYGDVTIRPLRNFLGLKVDVKLNATCIPRLQINVNNRSYVEVSRERVNGTEMLNDTLVVICNPSYCMSVFIQPHVQFLIDGREGSLYVDFMTKHVDKDITLLIVERKEKDMLYNPLLYFTLMREKIWNVKR